MQRLFDTIGQPELAQLGLSENSEDQQRLKATLTQAFAAQPFDYWQQVFAEIEACVEPVLSVTEAAHHPQLQARNMVVTVATGREASTEAQIGSPIKFSSHETQYRHTGSCLGAHTDEVLQTLGYNVDAREALRRCGALG